MKLALKAVGYTVLAVLAVSLFILALPVIMLYGLWCGVRA